MQGIKRNLRYWGYTMEYFVLVMLGTLLLISVLTGLDDPANLPKNTLRLIADMGFLYLFLMTCMIAFSSGGYMSLTLSMGSTRKDSFIGMQIMLHLIEAQLAVIVLLANAVVGKLDAFGDSILYTCIVYGAIVFGSIAVGNLILASILRLGRGAGFVIYFGILLVMLLGVAGLVVFKPVELIAALVKGPVILIGIVLDGISIAICYKVVKKLEVRV
ncbi:MAG: hypothetical protein ACI4EQ_10175 [Lachnospiraceae bacterium]